MLVSVRDAPACPRKSSIWTGNDSVPSMPVALCLSLVPLQQRKARSLFRLLFPYTTRISPPMLTPLVTGHPLGPQTGPYEEPTQLTTTRPELAACKLGRNEFFDIAEHNTYGLMSTRQFTSSVNAARAESCQSGVISPPDSDLVLRQDTKVVCPITDGVSPNRVLGPSELSNMISCSTFTTIMSTMLHDMTGKFVVIYFDDIIIFDFSMMRKFIQGYSSVAAPLIAIANRQDTRPGKYPLSRNPDFSDTAAMLLQRLDPEDPLHARDLLTDILAAYESDDWFDDSRNVQYLTHRPDGFCIGTSHSKRFASSAQIVVPNGNALKEPNLRFGALIPGVPAFPFGWSTAGPNCGQVGSIDGCAKDQRNSSFSPAFSVSTPGPAGSTMVNLVNGIITRTAWTGDIPRLLSQAEVHGAHGDGCNDWLGEGDPES
eukprot:gene913-biopygen3464